VVNNIETLAKKVFYLDDFLIDAQKGTIRVAGNSHQVEPKVMDVLLYLAAELGDVVEQEDLFVKVWPKSIYSPGSIRRCITVLRKIFQDDNKSLIVTHPKRGYSLQGKIHSPQKRINKPANNSKKVISLLLLTTALLLSGLSFRLFTIEQPAPTTTNINVLSVSPLTASELHEDSARFSPDGKYIAFTRSIEGNERLSHVWLKNVATEQEHQLTKQAAKTRSLEWMQTGNALFYVSARAQAVSITRITINEQAQATSEIEVLHLAGLTWISSIAWSSNNELYYIAKDKGKYRLVKNSLTTGEQKIIFNEDDNFHPYEITLSKDSQQLAIFALNKQYNATVKLIAIKGLSTKTINQSKEIVLGQNKYYGAWHPNNQSLLIHDGRELLSLNRQGKLQKISFENYQYIRYPEFSPDGKSILLTRQILDEDIWFTPNNNEEPAIKIIDSNTTDYLASISPDGKKVAFVSVKRGFPQLFVHDLKSGQQTLLFANPKQLLFIAYPVWNQSSTKIASALNQRPFIIELADDNYKTTKITYSKGVPVQWFFNEESLLLVNYHQGKKAYVKLSLDNKVTTTLLSSVEHHAQLSNDNELVIITDNTILQANFNGNQPTRLAQVDGKILNHYPTSKGIYLRVKTEDNFSLWFYTFDNNSLKKVQGLNKNARIWDVAENNDFMLTISHRSEKDLLLLSIAR